jgi:hypothetical protein
MIKEKEEEKEGGGVGEGRGGGGGGGGGDIIRKETVWRGTSAARGKERVLDDKHDQNKLCPDIYKDRVVKSIKYCWKRGGGLRCNREVKIIKAHCVHLWKYCSET